MSSHSTTSRLPTLDSLEVASGVITGPAAHPVAAVECAGDPRERLESIILEALQRGRCCVAFSGGRDSSAILALATHVARKAGLDEPVPVTLRFADMPRTDEPEWQELVIGHLGLDDWELVAINDELDVVGPLAGPALLRHGLYWPPNAHTLLPLLEPARGSCLLTGNGGDEVFSPWSGLRMHQVLHGQIRPSRRDLKLLAAWLSPEPLAYRALRRRTPFILPWLTPEGQREIWDRYARDAADRSRSWAAGHAGLLTSRYFEVAHAIMHALADDAGAVLVQPFSDGPFIQALGPAIGRLGPSSRTAALEHVVGDLLPRELISRSTKATFTEAFWGPASRDLAATWDGTGLDSRLVDADRLREAWQRAPQPDFRSMTAAQAVWLAAHCSSD